MIYKLMHSMIGSGSEYIRSFDGDKAAIDFFTRMWNDIKGMKVLSESRSIGKKYGIPFADGVYMRHDHASWCVEKFDPGSIDDK